MNKSTQAKLKRVVNAYNTRMSALFSSTTGTWWWEDHNVQLRIAQAACNYGGYIVTGTRHYCPIMAMQIDMIGETELVAFAGGHDNVIQGFTTQYGVFVDRKEGYKIALAAGQLLPRHEFGETLFSESYI